MKLLKSSANGIIHKIWIQCCIFKLITKSVNDVLQTLCQFNFSDWQIMTQCQPVYDIEPTLAQYISHKGSSLIQCWARLLVTLGQGWPNASHIGLTLVQCWTNVMRKLATRWDNIGPMSKITLGQHHFPTLALCDWLPWANVGPMLACYLGSSQF